ncbi:MAG TPA: type II toxin-antitoxin system prevent-host-death family antitoxin [Candidatus Krumholzibacteria bacterium]
MKIIGMRKLSEEPASCIDESQHDRVIITRHGKAVAVLTGVEGLDLEEVLVASDPDIAERFESARARRAPTRTSAEVRRRLGI